MSYLEKFSSCKYTVLFVSMVFFNKVPYFVMSSLNTATFIFAGFFVFV